MLVNTSLTSSKSKIGTIVPKKFQGDAGLANLGNTCFMNSTLQLLLHIEPLVAYFLSGQFSQDLNIASPTKGEVAASFNKLIQDIASRIHGDSVAPVELQKAVGHFAPYLMDYSQQDCQEFLRFDLDGLAEDLKRNNPVNLKKSPIVHDSKVEKNQKILAPFSPGNVEMSPGKLSCVEKLRFVTTTNSLRSVTNNNDDEIDDVEEYITKKLQNSVISDPVIESISDNTVLINNSIPLPQSVEREAQPPLPTVTLNNKIETRPPEILASIAWKDYLEKNNSVVTDIFAGQLQSTIECLVCNHKSYTFDPFLDISVPIPRVVDEAIAKKPALSLSNIVANTATRITPWRVRSNNAGQVDPAMIPGNSTKSSAASSDIAVSKCTLEDCLQIFTGNVLFYSD